MHTKKDIRAQTKTEYPLFVAASFTAFLHIIWSHTLIEISVFKYKNYCSTCVYKIVRPPRVSYPPIIVTRPPKWLIHDEVNALWRSLTLLFERWEKEQLTNNTHKVVVGITIYRLRLISILWTKANGDGRPTDGILLENICWNERHRKCQRIIARNLQQQEDERKKQNNKNKNEKITKTITVLLKRSVFGIVGDWDISALFYHVTTNLLLFGACVCLCVCLAATHLFYLWYR